MKTKRTTKKKPITKRKPSKRYAAIPCEIVQRQFEFNTEGRYFDLQTVFDKMNAQYFGSRLRRYTITWGQKRRKKPEAMIVFGSIQEEDRIIRIHPLLDREFVPRWYVEYVVFHEMLHAFVPDRYDSAGRRIVHHDGFLKRERSFRFYKRAIEWEQDNLGRFLR